jgi:hypothetical protein
MNLTIVLSLIWMYKWWIVGPVLAYIILRGNTPIGKPMRIKPGANVPPGESWFIESLKTDGASIHSCSFVEFDGQGDYVNFDQHQHVWEKVAELARRQQLLLVIYCHGWKNNSQSYDVVKFCDFLGRLAASSVVANFGYRVHGVYLGWRGNLYRPHIEKDGPTHAYAATSERFGGPVVSSRWSRRFVWTRWLQENLSYWSRRRAAEHKVSSVPMARTVYTCASLVKSIDKDKGRNIGDLTSSRVLVMGHSFGALMLERALNSTCLDPLIDQWSWFSRPTSEAPSASAHLKPLPLDFVFFVNSAAPSIYAKAMRDFLAAHQAALARAHSISALAPIFVSLTSSADSATRYAHPAANLLSRFYPSLRRKYTELIKLQGTCDVNQSWFYRRTPGHQPLLVDHWLEECLPTSNPPTTHAKVLEENLDYKTDNALEFWAHRSGKNGTLARWKFTLQPGKADRAWTREFGSLHPSRCSYWLIRCDKRIIRDHNDIWSDTTMEVYAALYRLVEWARDPNNAVSNKILADYWNGKIAVELAADA